MNGLFTRGYALLIGVGESAYSPLSLPVTVKDTQAIYKVLINPELCGYPEDNIKILNDNEATKNNILEGLQWLKEKAEIDRDATIFIYYSGHGWLDKNDQKFYLIQHDIKPTKIAKSALSAEEFTEAIRQIQSERLLVVIDSCHAAGMATSKDAEEELWDEFDDFQRQSPSKSLTSALSQGKGRVVFTSSEGEEKSWIMKDNSLSIYTFHFLEALQGAGNKAGDTVVKISNVMNYLGETVPKTAHDSHSSKQTPRFDFDTDDFAISMLRGGKGLPDKGWNAVKPEAHQNIYKIADNLTEIAEKIVNVTEMTGGQIGDVYHGNVTNKNYQQNENQGNIYNADEMTINQDKKISQSHSGSGDNVAGDKTVTNNYGINHQKENASSKGLNFPPLEDETSNTISNIEVPVYFATDRQRKESSNKLIKISYGGQRNSENQLEFSDIYYLIKQNLPANRRMGLIEKTIKNLTYWLFKA